jgi:hypothetical protein
MNCKECPECGGDEVFIQMSNESYFCDECGWHGEPWGAHHSDGYTFAGVL